MISARVAADSRDRRTLAREGQEPRDEVRRPGGARDRGRLEALAPRAEASRGRIAVEFENGQDLTYYWSATLPPGTIYRCPLPTWNPRETHWVLRSGAAGLGTWHEEERSVLDDYRAAIGGAPPARVLRVWLIAVSVFQRQRGRRAWAGISLRDGDRTVVVA